MTKYKIFHTEIILNPSDGMFQNCMLNLPFLCVWIMSFNHFP